MRYYSYNEFDSDGGRVVTMSEEEIRNEYWPYWYKKKCDKFGQEHVDAYFSFEECLIDWLTVHWAWEVEK